MIAVAADHRAQVFLGPFVEQRRIAVLDLGRAPFVKRFVEHDTAKVIADVEHLGSRRIVARAQGVTAHLFEDFVLPFDRATVDGRTERSHVVVHADAVEFDVTTVEEAALVFVKRDRANAETRFIGVGLPAVDRDAGDRSVEIG